MGVNAELNRQFNDYWSQRAESLSKITDAILGINPVFRMVLEHLLSGCGRYKALDLGTGSGLVAIELARMGFEVTAVDYNEDMLDSASILAEKYNVNIDFVLDDIQNPKFHKSTFDVIVCKDAVWNLQDPGSAYEKWFDLLTPGGRLVIFDTNYYLYLTKPEYKKRKSELEKAMNKHEVSMVNKVINETVDISICEELAKSLPLTKVFRPAWDVEQLMRTGFSDMRVHSMDHLDYYYGEEDSEVGTPMCFALSAVKTTPFREFSENMVEHNLSLNDLRKSMDLEYSNLGGVLKCLANEGCLKLMIALTYTDLTVSQSADVLNISHSLASHDLRMLKSNGIVDSIRDGKETIYFVIDRGMTRKLLASAMMIADTRHDFY